nr:DUF502 domain-containing protein [Thermostichus lividus]
MQQLLETILRDSRNRFRRVVLVEYPRRGLWAVAFVTGTINESLETPFSEPMLSLFVPSSPNPTTGWYVIASEREVQDLNISIEDAFKLIISGGIVTPETPLPQSLTPASLPLS